MASIKKREVRGKRKESASTRAESSERFGKNRARKAEGREDGEGGVWKRALAQTQKAERGKDCCHQADQRRMVREGIGVGRMSEGETERKAREQARRMTAKA
jgi:hypothetical protein